MKKLKARLGALLSLLGLPLLLAPLLLLDEGGGGAFDDGIEGGGDGAPPKTFTQAELDRIVQDRVARVKSAAPADYDDLKAKATRLDEIEAANKSELERAQEAQRQADERATRAEAERSQTRIETAVMLAAIKAGAADPDDVVKLLAKDAVTIGNDGQVTGVEDAVKALLEAKPHLVGKSSNTPTGDGDGGGRGKSSPAQLSRDDLKTMSPDAIVKAKAEGRLNDLLGVTT